MKKAQPKGYAFFIECIWTYGIVSGLQYDPYNCYQTHTLGKLYDFYLFKSPINRATALSTVGSASSALTNALPTMAPLEYWQAASKVALFDTPKPTKVWFFKPIAAMRLK